MKAPTISSLICILLLIFSCSLGGAWADHKHNHFLECFSKKFHNYSSISHILYSPTNSSYTSLLLSTLKNLRFSSDSTPKPKFIITPEHESQIPPIIRCAKRNDLQIRTRSGGHDFEGLSYVSQVPFVIIDLFKLNKIAVNVKAKTAWVEAGATLGSLYYMIAQKSPTLGFPAGNCPTVGVGGQLSGGGYSFMLRKYGLAADQVIDARIVDVIKGRILDRKSMGEDLFWAIRGGGGASFGVITAWKVKLVDVPEKVTVFRIARTWEQNVTHLVDRWQRVAHNLDRDLLIGVSVRGNKSMGAAFFSLFLGGVDRLVPLMQKSFPELQLQRQDCTEMTWVQSVLYFNGLPIQSPELLLNTSLSAASYAKIKSDYVQKPIPKSGFEGLWKLYEEPQGQVSAVYMIPYGGRMAEISKSAIPFPHRGGNLYMLANVIYWDATRAQNSERYINWSRRVYSYLAPYVSKSPRAAYMNYRDLDIGVNNNQGKTSYTQASIWGFKYLKNNFRRLARVKTVVDPDNFFRNEQSIPTLR